MNRLIAALLFLTAGSAFSQKYFFRHLMIPGSVSEIRTAYGEITLNGAGAYTVTGSQIIAAGQPTAFTANGTYTLKETGYITISNPQRAGANINAGLGQGAIVGSTTETGGVYDLFIAILAPTSPQSNASFSDVYDISALEFAPQLRNTAIRLTANGTGSASGTTLISKSANDGDRILVSANRFGANYSVTADGTGTLTLNGVRSLWLSNDGAIALFGAGHEIWIGTKSIPGPPVLNSLFFRAGLRYEASKPGTYAGSSNSTGSGKLVSSLRVRQPEGVLDFTAASNFSLGADGAGTLEGNRLATSATNFHTNGAAVTAGANYELSFAIRAPTPTGSGVFINPHGVTNAASFAPVGAPLSPGGFFTIFGSGLAAATTVASGLPFPTALGNVQVMVNNTAAPIYLASSGQISALVPQNATGTTASIVVVNNGQQSNTVEIPLARTAPGIFTIPPAGTGPGALLHANFTLVNADAPARRGETVQLFLTGLGATTPPISAGSPGPTSPLSLVTADVNVYIGGRPATVLFKGLAPGLAGLYQINFTVPTNAPTGSAIPLAVETPDAFHDMVDIAITN